MMQDSKRQKSSGLDFGVTPSNHLQPLVSSLGKALDGSDFGSRQLAGDYAASMLARTSEACLASGDAGRECSNILSSMMEALEGEAGQLQAALDLHSLPDVPQYCRGEASIAAAKRAATYAHRLSYTTFAPPVVLGQNLFRPPAPQDYDFRASCLHTLARFPSCELPGDAATAAGAPPAVEQDPATEQPSAELAKPLPELEAAANVLQAEQPEEPPEAAKKTEAPGFTSSAFDFILNPDVEVVDEEFSSSGEESE